MGRIFFDGYIRNYYPKRSIYGDVFDLLCEYAAPASDNIGIHQMIADSINRVDKEYRNEMWQNVVLAGGNTMFKGIADRLQNELTKLKLKSKSKIKVTTPE